MGVAWEDALKNTQEATQAGFNPKYSDLFRNLFFDFSNQDSYIIKKLDVKVTDVEEDFQKYSMYQKALADKEKSAEYYDENGKMLADYDYSKGAHKTKEISDPSPRKRQESSLDSTLKRKPSCSWAEASEQEPSTRACCSTWTW